MKMNLNDLKFFYGELITQVDSGKRSVILTMGQKN